MSPYILFIGGPRDGDLDKSKREHGSLIQVDGPAGLHLYERAKTKQMQVKEVFERVTEYAHRGLIQPRK